MSKVLITHYNSCTLLCDNICKSLTENKAFPLMYGSTQIINDIQVHDIDKEISSLSKELFLNITMESIINSNNLWELIKNYIFNIPILETNANIEPMVLESEINNLVEVRNSEQNQNLYFFMNKSKKLLSYSIEEVKIIGNSELNLNEEQGEGQALTVIPENKIFIYGGTSLYIDSAYIINLENNTVDRVSKGRKRSYAQATYLNNKIYVFGGYSNSARINSADEFDCITKGWRPLTPLKIRCDNTSTHILNDIKIFIAGSPKFVNIYNVVNECYEDVRGQFDIEAKCLVTYDQDKKIVFILSKKIYYCKEEGLDDWKVQELNQTFRSTAYRPVCLRRKAYFVDGSHKVFMFDFDSLRLEEVFNSRN
ncbi:hypothetical protein SteCoe_37549 [Stentor coeruleus]|uniref:BACK domain-containing protein n=1 Tax=Stentor coeruleus TaxID=5963 RepID=A0A1R2AMS5_9CILI|nr:hypothetical protein SteCoe_37549 [Stentor coeruleus]